MMKNETFYYLCNLKDKVALQYTQLPEVWGNISGMAGLPYEEVRSLAWANQSDFGFLTTFDCIELGISEESMAIAKIGANNILWSEIRQKRDVMLSKTDIAVTSDLWDTYTAKTKKNIAEYRQALRDITKQDIDTIEWPNIPLSLSFIKL